MNKASGGDGIPVELFQILKDDAVKVLHSLCQKIQKTWQQPQDWKRSIFIPIPKKGQCQRIFTLPYSCAHFTCQQGYAQNQKVIPARLQHYMNQELSDIQVGFRKGRGTRDQIANICWIMEKTRKFQKNIYFCFINYAKACNCVDHNKMENS